ncbi:autoinducer kinase [Enterobacter cancerogenus]|uniref:Autoinducer kinase n=1 Tax=Enterobacter cancerogenus TaxID=69218 RepID=A0A484WCN1_9ENTR|nr:autoinducer kinase [Enterobacter cancerogenus]
MGMDTYTLLEEMASRVPAGSTRVMPIFSRCDAFQASGTTPRRRLLTSPSTRKNATRPRCSVPLEENAAIVSACNLTQISRFSGVTFDSLVFAGGGAKGALWSQILSDVTRACRCACRKVKEATALGLCHRRRVLAPGCFTDMALHGRAAGEVEPRIYAEPGIPGTVRRHDAEMAGGVRGSAWAGRQRADYVDVASSGSGACIPLTPALSLREREIVSPLPVGEG